MAALLKGAAASAVNKGKDQKIKAWNQWKPLNLVQVDTGLDYI